MLEVNKIYNMDCLEGMELIDNKSIDLILADLPYGTTNRNHWDMLIPFDKLWTQYERIIKDNGAILLFADEPFTSELICSNKKLFKQRITWDKGRGTGFLNAKKRLMKQTEDICLFYKKNPVYNPQMKDAAKKNIRPASNRSTESLNYGKVSKVKSSVDWDPSKRYPTNLLSIHGFSGKCNYLNRFHPAQKPVELLEYLIKTYTNEGDLVLDNCIGSGSTAIAAIITGRLYIGFDNGIDDKTGKYWADIATERIETECGQLQII